MKEPQHYCADLSPFSGKTARNRNATLFNIVLENLPHLKLTYLPEYNPFIRTGVAQRNSGTQIGKNRFSSRKDLLDTIVHEELHHRWWKRGILDHHIRGSEKEDKFYKTIERYKKMRGWV